jgi:hypothetical protein
LPTSIGSSYKRTTMKTVKRLLCRILGGHEWGRLIDLGFHYNRHCGRCGATMVGGAEWKKVYENNQRVPPIEDIVGLR